MDRLRSIVWPYVLCALSMSLGWRVRGQFGHEIGAALPGALGAIALTLGAGRADWLARLPAIAFIGALGWSFGGSVSYMKVVAFTHSTDSATTLYGFAGLFLIGFLWAGLGGGAVALAASLEARRLASVVAVLAALFACWTIENMIADALEARRVDLDWFDTDWLSAAVAIAAALAWIGLRRRRDFGGALALHLAIGWWAAFLTLVVGLGWRLNPPRGDNWAGCVGMAGGWLLFCYRERLGDIARATLWSGFLGGIGFALAQAMKLSLIAAGAQGDTHVVLEWTHGALFGAALCVAALPLARRAPKESVEPLPRGARDASLLFLLWTVPYLNFAKCPAQWAKAFPSLANGVHGLPVVAGFLPSKGWVGWVDLLFIAYGAALWWLLRRSRRAPTPWLSADGYGRGQWLYLTLVGMVVVLSFARDVTNVGAGDEWRILWFIVLHGVLCLVVALGTAMPQDAPLPPRWAAPGFGAPRTVAVCGLAAAVAACTFCWGVQRLLFRGTFPGQATPHIRFGPENTNDRK